MSHCLTSRKSTNSLRAVPGSSLPWDLSLLLLAWAVSFAFSATGFAQQPASDRIQTAASLAEGDFGVDPAELCPQDGSPDLISNSPNCFWNPAPGDEIWLINTRNLDNCHQDCTLIPDLPVSRWEQGEFRNEDFGTLMEQMTATPQIRNIVYIHGNFTDLGWSIRRGLQVYDGCFANAPARPPVRFIIWSWRSERETLLGKDYRIKSQRAIAEGCRLNSVVTRLGPKPPIVIGYSLGAQATLSALAQADSSEGQRWVVALIAAALDPYFCSTLKNNQQIADRFSHLVVFTNHVDPALNCSLRITRRATAIANPPSQYSIVPNLKSGNSSVEQYEVGREVGYHHAISNYLSVPLVTGQLRALLEK